MPSQARDELIRALTARIRRFCLTFDHDAVLSPDALALTDTLRGRVPDPTRDPEAVRAILGLHRCRVLCLGDRAGSDAAVVAALEPLAAEAAPRESADHLLATVEQLDVLVDAADSAVEAALANPDPGLMSEALAACRRAAEHVPTELLPFRATILSNWGVALQTRYERHHDLPDLHAAIATLRQAEALVGPGHPGRTAVLNGLGVCLRLRYERAHAAADVQDAVLYAQAVAREATPDRDHHPGHLHNLGLALRLRYERHGTVDDLHDCVRAHRDAVAAAAPDHPGYPIFQLGLGNALGRRIAFDDTPADRREQMASYQQATSHAVGVEVRAAATSALATTLVDTLVDTGVDTGTDLDRAVDLLTEALATMPEGHSAQVQIRYLLGRALLARSARPAPGPDLAAALGCHRAAARHPAGPTHVRLLAAAHWGAAAMAMGDPAQAVQAYALAVGLLPKLTARHLGLSDAEDTLARVPSLASDAAACALLAGDPEQAVTLLDMGRGVLLARGIQGHDDVTELRSRAPDLADRLLGLRDALDPPTPSAPGVAYRAVEQRDARHVQAQEWDTLVAQIRASVPGLHRFLQPPSVAELLDQAASGPVVLVNVSRFGSAALALTRHGVRVVPLPDLTPEAADAEAAALLTALARLADPATDLTAHPGLQDRIHATLCWLWDAVAAPVLDELHVTGAALERLWWVPTGPLVVLPLHAAGYHREPGGHAVLERAVSSYAPTVRALAYARRDGGGHRAAASALVAAVPEAPGAPALPRAAAEAAAVAALLPAAEVLLGEEAHRDAVLDGLRRHPWLHFSGHAVADRRAPSASRLLVHDHLRHPLTVAEVARLDLRDAELAYLSACGTADAGLRLADESLHLTSALQLAGYRNVVGTLWSVEDTVAKEIAEAFYRDRRWAQRPAHAVHDAVLGARAAYRDAPSHWAAHIHVGA